MRLLVVNTEKTWRGGERQTLYNIVGFLQQGVQVELLCRKNYPLSEKSRQLGVKVSEVSSTADFFLWLMLHAVKYDLIHVQTARAQTFAVLTKWFHRRPIIYTRRVDFVPQGFFTKIKYRATDCVVAISTPVKMVLEKAGIHVSSVIYDAVEPRELNRHRALEIIAPVNCSHKKVVASVSALVQHKDPLVMVEAIRMLSSIRSDFVFLHFGDGVLQNQVQKKIDEYKLNEIYWLMGFVPDVEDVFAAMDVFCMSSEEEGLGSSVLDAFVYKVPVVSTRAGGLAEVVEGRDLLCAIKDARCLAECINKILSHPEEYSRTLDSAAEYARTVHSIENTSKQYIDLFHDILGR